MPGQLAGVGPPLAEVVVLELAEGVPVRLVHHGEEQLRPVFA